MSRDVLALVAASLTRAGIPHMLTGSFAAAWYGAPRATLDYDLVIDPTVEQLRQFVASFDPAEFYVSLDAALEAREHETQFNLLDLESGWKVDLILRKSRPFNEAEFDRRSSVDVGGSMLPVVTAEDLVIAKLEWARLGGSTRQIEDVARLLDVRADRMDPEYLAQWVSALGLDREWAAAAALRTGQ